MPGIFFLLWCVVSVESTAVIDVFENGSLSIRDAINQANANDTIRIHGGTYTGPANCNLNIASKQISVIGDDGATTVIDCGGFNSRCLSIVSSKVTIRHIQFSNGVALGTATTAASSNAKVMSIHVNKSRNIDHLLPRRRKRNAALLFTMQVLVTADGQWRYRLPAKKPPKTASKVRNVNKTEPDVIRTATPTNPSFMGGNLYISANSVVVLDNVMVVGGSAVKGGGIAATDSVVTLTGGSLVAYNGIASDKYDVVVGAGAYFARCNTTITNATFSNNFLQSYSRSSGVVMYGAGLCIEYGFNVSIAGPVTASQNVISAYQVQGTVVLQASGICIYKCLFTTLSGSITVSNNSMSHESNQPPGASASSHLEGTLYFEQSPYTTLDADIVVLGNTISLTLDQIGSDFVAVCRSGGLHIISSDFMTISGTIISRDNSIQVVVAGSQPAPSTSSAVGHIRAYGGGMSLVSSNGITISSSISTVRNQISVTFPSVPTANNIVQGAGMLWYASNNLNAISASTTSFYSSDNALSAVFQGSGGASTCVWGAGFCIYLCTNTTLKFASLTVSRNLISVQSATGDSTVIMGGGFILREGTGINQIMGGNLVASDNRIQSVEITTQTYESYIYGGGFIVMYTNGAICNASFIATDNRIEAILLQQQLVSAGSGIAGVGFCFLGCSSLILDGVFAAARNVLDVYSEGTLPTASVGGAGFYMEFCYYSTIYASIVVANNTLQYSAYNATSTIVQGNGIALYEILSAYFLGALLHSSDNTIEVVSNSGEVDYIFGAGIYLKNSISPRFYPRRIEARNNILKYDGYGTKNANVQGSGLYIQEASFLDVRSSMLVSGNSIIHTTHSSTGNAYCQGAGMFMSTSDSSQFHSLSPHDTFRFENNSVIYRSWSPAGRGFAAGGGAYFLFNLGVWAENFVLVNNSVASQLYPSVATTYIPPPSTNRTDHCSGIVTIPDASGTINDGSLGNYHSGIHCSWLLQPSAIRQGFWVYNISFTAFETDLQYDSLSIFDGPSSYSQLIGQYSGDFVHKLRCGAGQCPPLTSPILSTSGQLYIVFATDPELSSLFDGFTMTWNLVNEENRTSSPIQALLMSVLDSYPSYSVGGGMVVSSTAFVGTSMTFASNAVQDLYLAAAGGLFVQYDSSSVQLSNSTFAYNQVQGIVAAGGAIGAFYSATLSCSHCSFDSNNATSGASSCFFAPDVQGVLCASSFGGAILAASRASVALRQGSILQGNIAKCSSSNLAQCTRMGGAVAAVHANTLLQMDQASKCISCGMTTAPDAKVASTYAAGGCIYADSSVVVVNSMVFQKNSVDGIGSGGAISATGTTSVSVSSTLFYENTAMQGGAINLASSAKLNLSNHCNFSRNAGYTIAGALAIRDDAALSMDSVVFDENTASRASTIFSYNDNRVARYIASNVYVRISPGSAALMLGQFQFDASTVFNCTWPGSVFLTDFTDQFFSLSCIPCSVGTYAVDIASTLHISRQCEACPFGASCSGSSLSSNGLKAIGGYWGEMDADSGKVSFYPCPSGYCCPEFQTCDYNFCSGLRTGRLCGTCAQGYGMRLFSDSCGPDSSCHDVGWFFFVLLLGSIGCIAFLLKTTGNPSTGMIAVLLYFYQVLPLVKSTSWKYTSPTLITILVSVFNMAPASSSSSSSGVCIAVSMTTVQKLTFRMLMQGIVMLVLGTTLLLHVTLTKYSNFDGIKNKFSVNLSHYFAVAIRFCTIAFTTLVLVPLEMLQCIDMNGWKWWYDANIECLQGWQIACLVAVCILLCLPMGVIMLLVKRWTSEAALTAKWQKETWSVFTNGYKVERRWWLGVSLYRRFLLVVASTMVMDSNWKSVVVTSLCLLFAVINVVMQPFKSDLTQKFETVSLTMLGILAASVDPQLSKIEFGTLQALNGEAVLEWIQLFLALGPIVGYILMLFLPILKRVLPSRGPSTVGSSEASHDDPEDAKECWTNSMEICPSCGENAGHFSTECDVHQYC